MEEVQWAFIISLPISLLLLWLVLKPKKGDPFPKGGMMRLLIAGVISAIVIVVKLVCWRKKGTLDVPVLSDPAVPVR